MEFTVENLSVKTLVPTEIPKLQQLFDQSKDFFELVNGRPALEHEAEELFQQLPEHKTIQDKFVLGIYHESSLVGVIDLIKDYPKQDVWFIGLLLLSPDFRNKGIGGKIYKKLKETIKNLGALSIMISVAEQNTQALSFWNNLGFTEIDSKIKKHGNKESRFIRLQN